MDTSTQATELIPVKGPTVTTAKRTVPHSPREATDRRRDVGRGCIGGASGAGAWHPRQPGLRPAQAVSGGATGRHEPCDQVIAGPGKRGFAIASDKDQW